MFRVLQNICFQSAKRDFIRVASAVNVNWTKKLYKNANQKIFKVEFTSLDNKQPFVPIFLFGGIMTFLGLAKEDEEKEPELITILKRSILLIQKEEFKGAEEMLHIALKMAQDQRNSDGITYVFDIMANLAYNTGDYPKAYKLFVTVMQRLMADGVDATDNRMIHISVKLAKIYQSIGEKEKAEEGYKFCIENLEHKITKEEDNSEDTLLLWAMALDYYAHFLLEANRLKEAYHCLDKAYKTCIQVNGKEHEQTVVLLNDLGTISNLMGNADRAVSLIEEAVDIGSQLPEMKDLGSIYVNLGHVYFLKKMLDECEKACMDGKKLATKYGDKETQEEAKVCLKEVRQAMKG